MDLAGDPSLPGISKIDTDARESFENPGMRIWFENGAKIQVVEDDQGLVERQWFGPDHIGEPEAAHTIDDAEESERTIAEVGLEMVADYIAFENETDAREHWGDEYGDILFIA